MSLEDDFNGAIQEWIEHCRNPQVQIVSSDEAVNACDAYKKIVSMGTAVLPFIRRVYDKDAAFYVHSENERGEFAEFSTGNLPYNTDFMDALLSFQYGETAEESDAGFSRMTRLGKKEAERDLPLSIIKGRGLVSVVGEIIGDDFQIPEGIRGRIPAMEEYIKRWLDENINKYVPTK